MDGGVPMDGEAWPSQVVLCLVMRKGPETLVCVVFGVLGFEV